MNDTPNTLPIDPDSLASMVSDIAARLHLHSPDTKVQAIGLLSAALALAVKDDGADGLADAGRFIADGVTVTADDLAVPDPVEGAASVLIAGLFETAIKRQGYVGIGTVHTAFNELLDAHLDALREAAGKPDGTTVQ